MSHFDPELQTYAENGLRSAQDWANLGRQLKDGATPRAETTVRRVTVTLFGRDQTNPAVKLPKKPKAPKVTSTAAPTPVTPA